MAVSSDNARITITVDKELKKKLKVLSIKEECSVSKICLKIISDYMKRTDT